MKHLHDEACKNKGFHSLPASVYALQRSPAAIYDLHERTGEKTGGKNIEDKQ